MGFVAHYVSVDEFSYFLSSEKPYPIGQMAVQSNIIFFKNLQ